MKTVHLRNLDLNLLPVFQAVYESGSVAVAARRLGLSQPALSHALRRLRDALGDELFVRSGRGMRPTPLADRLAGPVRQGLTELGSALSGPAAFDASSSDRLFRLAMADHAEWLLMPGLLERLRREAPRMRVQARRLEALFVPPSEALRRGTLDAAVSYFPDMRGIDGSLLQDTLWKEWNVVVGRRGQPALRRRITLEAFAEAGHAAVIYGEDAQGFIDRELAARGLRRKLVYASPSFSAVLRVVASTDLLACLPRSVVLSAGAGMEVRWQAPPLELPEFSMRVVWARVTAEDGAWEWFRSRLAGEAKRLRLG